MNDEIIWTEKYRPRTIDDVILPESMKQSFRTMTQNGSIPNIILAGTSGVGKTTIARAMLDEINADYMIINGSLEGRLLDTLRNQIVDFASTVSVTGNRKFIILDEADGIRTEVQEAMRNLMEDLSSNCGFIFTCNHKAKITAAIQSRCSVIDFKLLKEDKAKIATLIMKRLIYILDKENISYEKEVLAGVIKRYMPDWRRIINELQRYSNTNGSIDNGILAAQETQNADYLIEQIKDKSFTNIRKWVGENADVNYEDLFHQLYLTGVEKVTKESIPSWVMILAEYQHRLALVSSPEVTVVAMFMQLMMNSTFK